MQTVDILGAARFHNLNPTRIENDMWSYVQYRRLGKDVEGALKKQSAPTGRHSAGVCSNLESGQRPITLQTLDSVDEKGRKRVVSMGEDDPLDPKNWPLVERCKNVAILCFLIFTQAWAGAAESMASTAASEDVHVSKVAGNLSTTMYLFGIGSGSLFGGPVSETVGRNPTYLASMFCYLCFVLGCALTKTFSGQVVCRYFVGSSSSATLSTNGASIRDQFSFGQSRERSRSR